MPSYMPCEHCGGAIISGDGWSVHHPRECVPAARQEDKTQNGWSEYQKLVMAELSRHANLIANADAKLDKIRHEDLKAIAIEIAMLKVKAGIWGALAGLIPAAIGILVSVLK